MGCEQEERIVADTWVLSAGHKVDTGPNPRIQIPGQRGEGLGGWEIKLSSVFGCIHPFTPLDNLNRNIWIHHLGLEKWAEVWTWVWMSLIHGWPSNLGVTQFSSVQSLSYVWLCDPMDCSMPGFPVHHQLLEFTHTHVNRVGDAIQPSHPLSSPSPPAFNLSQHQGLFKWVNSSHQVTKVLEFQLQHQSFQWIFRTDFV